jgi:hypothetical protein
VSDTLLPVQPLGEEQLYYPSETNLIQVQHIDEGTQAFYNGLNVWMELLRAKSGRVNEQAL